MRANSASSTRLAWCNAVGVIGRKETSVRRTSFQSWWKEEITIKWKEVTYLYESIPGHGLWLLLFVVCFMSAVCSPPLLMHQHSTILSTTSFNLSTIQYSREREINQLGILALLPLVHNYTLNPRFLEYALWLLLKDNTTISPALYLLSAPRCAFNVFTQRKQKRLAPQSLCRTRINVNISNNK